MQNELQKIKYLVIHYQWGSFRLLVLRNFGDMEFSFTGKNAHGGKLK
jgi:hypothetical protein